MDMSLAGLIKGSMAMDMSLAGLIEEAWQWT